ncbi:MAG: hypothetical protein RBJ76_01035 [Stenomitos frigidus ULC029]
MSKTSLSVPAALPAPLNSLPPFLFTQSGLILLCCAVGLGALC